MLLVTPCFLETSTTLTPFLMSASTACLIANGLDGTDSTGNLIVANELITIKTKGGGELPLITLATKAEPEWIK